MIRKLKIKFIILSVTALFVLLSILVAGMNVINYTTVLADADEILSFLSQNRGTFPDFGTPAPSEPVDRLPSDMSPELPYESRYFSVLMGKDGKIVYADVSRITSVDTRAAIAYANEAMEEGTMRGFVDEFRYVRYSENGAERITFLDCSSRLSAFYAFFSTSILIALAGFAFVSLVLCFFAGRIIRPIAESYEKQKRFITDAGHEIKTPLTIINANVDILEMELGSHESLSDIVQQTKRLTSLTHDLVSLARMEEGENTMQMIEFPISEIVQESAEAFKAPAQMQGKTFTCDIQPMLSLKGNDKTIGQLVSLLMDNALKYSPAGGQIALKLARQNRSIVLTVFNTTEIAVDTQNLDRVFDRFYRADPSRSSQIGGHGIGLSLAKAIVTAHGGKINASSKDGYSFVITVVLPM